MHEIQSIVTLLQHRCFQIKRPIDDNEADVLVRIFLVREFGERRVGELANADIERLINEILDYLSNPLELVTTVPLIRLRCMVASLVAMHEQECRCISERFSSLFNATYKNILGYNSNDYIFKEILNILCALFLPVSMSQAPSKAAPLINSANQARMKAALGSILSVTDCGTFRNLLKTIKNPEKELYDVLCVCWGVYIASLSVAEAEEAIEGTYRLYVSNKEELQAIYASFVQSRQYFYARTLEPLLIMLPDFQKPLLRNTLAQLKTTLSGMPSNISVPRSVVLPIFSALGKEWIGSYLSDPIGSKYTAGLTIFAWWTSVALDNIKGLLSKTNINTTDNKSINDRVTEASLLNGIDDQFLFLTPNEFCINSKDMLRFPNKRLYEREMLKTTPIITDDFFSVCEDTDTCEKANQLVLIKGDTAEEFSFIKFCCEKEMESFIGPNRSHSILGKIINIMDATINSKLMQHYFLFGLCDYARLLLQDNVQSILIKFKDSIQKTDKEYATLERYTNKAYLTELINILSHPSLRMYKYRTVLDKFVDANDIRIEPKLPADQTAYANVRREVNGNMVDEEIMTPEMFPSSQRAMDSPIQFSSSEWEMRRQLIHLHNLSNKSTHSTQTYATHFKRDGSAQTIEMKDATTGTATEAGTDAVKHIRVLNGLVGEKSDIIESHYVYDPN